MNRPNSEIRGNEKDEKKTCSPALMMNDNLKKSDWSMRIGQRLKKKPPDIVIVLAPFSIHKVSCSNNIL